MEQHPVPRNISSFQFRLIGDMTVRQFGYLAGGGILAYIIFKLALLPAIINIPLAAVFAIAGIAFAFLPIQERPLDRWLVAFIKSIFSPSQYLWHKDSTPPEIFLKPVIIQIKNLSPVHIEAHRDAREKLKSYLNTLPSQPHQTLNAQEKSYIDNTLILFNTAYKVAASPTQQPPSVLIAAMSPAATQARGAILPTQAIPTPHMQPSPPPVEKAKASPPPQPAPQIKTVPQTSGDLALQQKLKALAAEKEVLTSELTALRQEINKGREGSIVKPVLAPEEKRTPTIKSVSAKAAIDEIGMPQLPQTPNVVSGVIKDAARKILPNIILTIKDVKGVPIRALKTNKLGLFVTATPLPNGTYLIEAEDPLKRYLFDIAQITVDGKVFLPIEITARGEKDLIREKLSKELFGNANI